MAQTAEAAILESLKCAICLEFAFDAVESSCCNSVFCESCLRRLRPPACCPLCRSHGAKMKFQPARAVRKALDNLPAECPHGCSTRGLTRSGLRDHAAKCSSAGISCGGCSWSGSRGAYVGHLVTAHENDLVKNGHLIFLHGVGSDTSNHWRGFIETRRRSSLAGGDSESRLGSTGVRYCRGPLPGRCGCCNGFCGPTNGCCCNDCMLVHVRSMNLPAGWLVNREGAVSRRSPVEDRFYCGRRVMENDRMTDGYCGPTNGHNCFSCRKLELLVGEGWYRAALTWRGT